MLVGLMTDIDGSFHVTTGPLDWPIEALLRMVLAMAAGAVIGFEREVRARNAGFRTMMLVCVGSALVMIVSIHLAYVDWPAQTQGENRINVDPGRIAYGVMTGIGFIGAGTIIERRGRPQGLTTAAAIWCVAAIGMAIGFGLYVLAVLTTILVLVALWLMDYLEESFPRRRTREIVLRTPYRPGIGYQTVERLQQPRLLVERVAMQRHGPEDEIDITLRLSYNGSADQLRNLERELEDGHDYQLISSREL